MHLGVLGQANLSLIFSPLRINLMYLSSYKNPEVLQLAALSVAHGPAASLHLDLLEMQNFSFHPDLVKTEAVF